MFKPGDIFNPIPEFISSAELMESDLEQNISVQTIYGQVETVTLDEYHSKDEVDSDVFFTRSFFCHKTKELKPPLSQ